MNAPRPEGWPGPGGLREEWEKDEKFGGGEQKGPALADELAAASAEIAHLREKVDSLLLDRAAAQSRNGDLTRQADADHDQIVAVQAELSKLRSEYVDFSDLLQEAHAVLKELAGEPIVPAILAKLDAVFPAAPASDLDPGPLE